MKPINIIQKLNESEILSKDISDNPESDYEALDEFREMLRKAEDFIADDGSEEEAYSILISNLEDYNMSSKLLKYLKSNKTYDSFCDAVDEAMSILDGTYTEYEDVSEEELKRMFNSKQFLDIKKFIDSFGTGPGSDYGEPSVNNPQASWFFRSRGPRENIINIPLKKFVHGLEGLGVTFPFDIRLEASEEEGSFEVEPQGHIDIFGYDVMISFSVIDAGYRAAVRGKVPTESDYNNKYLIEFINVIFPERTEVK